MTAVRTAAVLMAVAVVPLTAAPMPAAAHSVLLSTTPADSTVVTATVGEVTLTFNEPPRADFSTVVVTGPEGVHYADGPVRVVDNVVRQAVHPLRSGDYEVAWRVASADGHPISGSFRFAVDLPATLEPTAVPPPAEAARQHADFGWWWFAAAAGAAALVGLAVLVGRRRRAVS